MTNLKQVVVSATVRAVRMAEIAKEIGEDRSAVVECTFEPLQRFSYLIEDDETGARQLIADYVPGNTYNCTRFAVHDFLREMVAEWADQGLVAKYNLPRGKSFVMNSVPGGN